MLMNVCYEYHTPAPAPPPVCIYRYWDGRCWENIYAPEANKELNSEEFYDDSISE